MRQWDSTKTKGKPHGAVVYRYNIQIKIKNSIEFLFLPLLHRYNIQIKIKNSIEFLFLPLLRKT